MVVNLYKGSKVIYTMLSILSCCGLKQRLPYFLFLFIDFIFIQVMYGWCAENPMAPTTMLDLAPTVSWISISLLCIWILLDRSSRPNISRTLQSFFSSSFLDIFFLWSIFYLNILVTNINLIYILPNFFLLRMFF